MLIITWRGTHFYEFHKAHFQLLSNNCIPLSRKRNQKAKFAQPLKTKDVSTYRSIRSCRRLC